MELLKKVSRLEVKRCFVLSQRFTSKKMRKDEIKKHIIKPEKVTFLKNLEISKKAILKMKETEIDQFIAVEYKKRLKAYDGVEWFIGYVYLSEVGIWKGAGGIPKAWSTGSLLDSAQEVAKELRKTNSKYSRIRAIKAVPEIIKFKAVIKKEKYLLPIMLPGGTIPVCRKGMRPMNFDVDDGCMRSLAFAVSGDGQIKAYVGIFAKDASQITSKKPF
ncbi:MAG: hypothetical protein WC848_02650 [Parcubacteria group bacterium]|jgi:hypothetical protein